MCEFLTDEASDDNFTDFYFIVDRLIQVGNDKVAHMFNARDSHIWFGLFSRFINTGLDDERFIDFMVEFDKSLHSKEVDGVSYDSINGRNTKDKNAIKRKMELLEKLMCEYLAVEHKDTNNVDTLEFITKNVDSNATEEDISLYEAMLDDCLKVDNPINTARNRPSLLALVAYGVKHDKDEEVQSWFGDVGSRAGTYLLNQKQNYDSMLDSLTKYVEEQTRKTA
jgi:hypothetical protein